MDGYLSPFIEGRMPALDGTDVKAYDLGDAGVLREKKISYRNDRVAFKLECGVVGVYNNVQRDRVVGNARRECEHDIVVCVF